MAGREFGLIIFEWQTDRRPLLAASGHESILQPLTSMRGLE